jgi:HKD family nuclease
MPIQFYSDRDVLRQINHQTSESNESIFAVAFWGKGAIEQLRLEKFADAKKKITIICNLMSGACNPLEMRKLLNLKEKNDWTLKFHNELHAKIYWTPSSVIIGSSNVSSNGLCYDGSLEAGLLEANLQTDDKDAVKVSEGWLRDLAARSNEVTNVSIDLAEKIWISSRQKRVVRAGTDKTFLQVLRNNPETLYDRNIEIWLFENEGLDPPAEAVLNSAVKELRNSKIDCYQDVSSKKTPAGMYVIDFSYETKSNGRIKFPRPSVWQMLSTEHIRRYAGGNIALCVEVKKIYGLEIDKFDRDSLKPMIESYLESKPKLLKKLGNQDSFEISVEDLSQHFSS